MFKGLFLEKGLDGMAQTEYIPLDTPLNTYIDHTLLNPQATHEDFQTFLDEAIKYKFASVCVVPYLALTIKEALKDYPEIKICTVVGFPQGNIPAIVKAQEAYYFAKNGIDEIDFVINYSLLKSGRYDDVGAELKAIDQVCTDHGTVSKCIVETCYLTDDEKKFMYEALWQNTNIDYIKTSTGYGPEGAQLVDVLNWNTRRNQEIIKQQSDLLILHEAPTFRTKGPLKIKAAGGIRDLETALKFIACGADRLGMSASVKIMEEYNNGRPTD